MNNQEWLEQLSVLTALPYYPQHKVFGDKSGALIGTRDGFVIAVGPGKTEKGHAAIHLSLRYSENADPKALAENLKSVKGKFDAPKSDSSTTILVRTYSLGKPAPQNIAEDVNNIIAKLKTCAMPLSGKCEKCQKSGTDLVLMNNFPVAYCQSCQSQLGQQVDAAAHAYENLETNLPLGILYGVAAALIGSLAWGGVAYAINRIFLWGAIIIGVFIGKAVVMGMGKVNWTGRILIGALTAASVAFGDALFYTFVLMKQEQATFMLALKAVLSNFWKVEQSSDGGVVSILFGLIGAGVVMYSTRKPEFKAQFVPLGAPATTMAAAVAAK